MKINVQVAEYHVANGRRFSECACPVALAINLCLPAGWVAKVFGWNVRIWNGKSAIELDLPTDVSRRIALFDASGVFEPFLFELWIPEVMFEEVACG